MPPRKNKRRGDEQDEEIDKIEEKSRWAHILKNTDKDEEEEVMPKKEIFNFDFSKEHLLIHQKEPVRKEEPKIQLTEKEKAELERKLQKQKKQKDQKEKIRREKKVQKQKLVEKEKQEQKIKKEVEEKQEQELGRMVSKHKGNSDSKKILLVLFVLMVVLGLLQYQKDIYARLSKFRITSEVNLYEVMEASSSVSDGELRNLYKQLVVKYHPDKNPNCHSCKEKFNAIMEAWEVLGNPEKRKHYDQNSGFISQIQSQTLTLTPDNYDWLLYDSDAIWLVQVYDSTSEYCHYFASFWEQFARKYEGLVRVGRIDVWQQSEMKSYIPFKFQLFPGLYTMHMGQEMLCQLDFDRPIRSLQLCVQQRVELATIPKIRDWAEIPSSDTRQAVIIGGGVRLSVSLKLIHSRFARYLSFYVIKDQSTMVLVKGRDYKFDLSSGSKTVYKKYGQFLEGMVRQKRSGCQIYYECRERPCLLLLDDQMKHDQLHSYPLLQVKEKQQFLLKIEHIKNVTGLFEKFEVGYYQDGKVELGYFSQLEELRPENGQVIEFVCRKQSLLVKLLNGYDYVMNLILKK